MLFGSTGQPDRGGGNPCHVGVSPSGELRYQHQLTAQIALG
jgi:hypothetical protein